MFLSDVCGTVDQTDKIQFVSVLFKSEVQKSNRGNQPVPKFGSLKIPTRLTDLS